MNKDKIDCNKLMVDIFSKLYGVMKIKFIEYERYAFGSINENNDIIVSSYGKDYMISKEYFDILEFKKINKKEKEDTESKKEFNCLNIFIVF